MKTRKRGRKPKAEAECENHVDSDDLDTTCGVCQAEFVDPADLRVHTAQVHPPPAPHFTCELCAAPAPSAEHYLLHIRDHHLAHLNCCMYCSRGFTDKDQLIQHEKKHQSDVEDKFACSHCRVLFANIKALESHELTHHYDSDEGVMLQKYYPHLSTILCMKADDFMQTLSDELVYTCCKCKFTTGDTALYLKHLSDKNCRCFSCHKCNKIFVSKKSLPQHFKAHPECYDGLWNVAVKKECKHCKQLFGWKIYKSHILRCKIIQCIKCNLVFDTIQDLTAHQAEHPNTISLKRCRYCHQELVGSPSFYKHMERVHRRDYHLYKYNCVYCEAFFKHPKNLFGHLFSKHKDIKPYSCNICNEKFHLRKTFTIHIKMKHASTGFVEFDENLNVFFAENKSENPFQPAPNSSLYNEEEEADRPKNDQDEVETDFNTDVEGPNKKGAKKKRVMKRKVNASKDDRTDADTTEIGTETDAHTQNEAETMEGRKPTKRLTRKRKLNTAETAIEILDDESSDDEPLLKVRKRINIRRDADKKIVKLNKSKTQNAKSKLTCNVCKKYCFTVQNYHRHISLHFKSETKQCIKCAKLFSSGAKLQEHLETAHATSHITATLKKLLERRKLLHNVIGGPISARDKFRMTIKKVHIPKCDTVARLQPANNKELNVKNFLESFSPEKGADKSVATITEVKNYTKKQPIKMTKFRPTPMITGKPKLRMPTKFNRTYNEVVTATVKEHRGPISKPNLNFGCHVSSVEDLSQVDNYDDYTSMHQDEYVAEAYGSMQNVSIIPDVGHEVMLENTEETPRAVTRTPITHTVELPKANKYMPRGIQIAHLQPQAPYYKIVPYEQVLKQSQPERPEMEDVREEIELPSGTKLVNSNPLAHLMANRTVSQGNETWRKYNKYKPKLDHKTALANAMLKLQETPLKKHKPKK